MTLLEIIICFLAGAGAGIGTGFAGMSAAGIISPMLLTFCGIPPYEAIGIGLASDVLASAVSAWTYKKHDNLDIRNSWILLTSVLVMTIVGSAVASLVPSNTMGGMSQIGLLILGIKFLLKPERPNGKNTNDNLRIRIIKTIAGGVVVGFICGFIGAGGGMMLLFVLTSILGYEVHKAVGTSVFIMCFTAFIGSISHFGISGTPNWGILVLCVIFTFIWARIASVIANRASERALSRAAGIVMVVTSCIILYFNYLR